MFLFDSSQLEGKSHKSCLSFRESLNLKNRETCFGNFSQAQIGAQRARNTRGVTLLLRRRTRRTVGVERRKEEREPLNEENNGPKNLSAGRGRNSMQTSSHFFPFSITNDRSVFTVPTTVCAEFLLAASLLPLRNAIAGPRQLDNNDIRVANTESGLSYRQPSWTWIFRASQLHSTTRSRVNEFD